MREPIDDVADPNTAAERLSELAASNPELGAAISAHPNSYPALREWIETYASVSVGASTAAPEAHSVASAQVPGTSDPYARASGSASTRTGTAILEQPSVAPTSTVPQNPFGPGGGAKAPSGTSPAIGSFLGRLSHRGRVIACVAAVLVVVLIVAGGGAWWYFSSKLGGAASPEAAAVKLVSSLQTMDTAGLYGSLAPGEVNEVSQAFQKLSNSHPKKGGVNVQNELTALKAALTITTTGVAYRTDTLADGVARVVWTEGSIKISGNPKKVSDVIVDLEAPFIRAEEQENGESAANIDRNIASIRKESAHSIQLPQTLKASKAGGFSLVVVKEGTGWFVSPVLSVVDEYFRSYTTGSSGFNVDGNASTSFLNATTASKMDSKYLGSSVAEAGNYSTPEAAAKALVDATTDTDSQELAATLPLSERRMVSVYGPWIERLVEVNNNDNSNKTLYGNLSIKSAKFSSTISGNQANVRIDDLDVADGFYNSNVGQNLTTDLQVQGTCASMTGQRVEDEGYTSAIDGSWVSDEQVTSTHWRGCFSDVPVLKRLDFTKISLVAVKENGGWFISPFATTSNAISIVTDNFLTYYNSDRLKQLFAR